MAKRGRPSLGAERRALTKEYYNLLVKLRSRFKTIEKRFGATRTSTSFNIEFGRQYGSTSIKNISNEQLQAQVNQLRYYDERATSRVAGEKQYRRVKEVLGKGVDDVVLGDVYERLVEEKLITEQYKYEAIEMLDEAVQEARSMNFEDEGDAETYIHHRVASKLEELWGVPTEQRVYDDWVNIGSN